MSTPKGLRVLKFFREYIKNPIGFDKTIVDNVNFISGGNGNSVVEIEIKPQHVNINGSIHGAFTATLVDGITTLALLTHDNNNDDWGLTLDMHVSYLGRAVQGDVIKIEGRTLKIGKKIAFVEADLVNQTTGEIVARGFQSKYLK